MSEQWMGDPEHLAVCIEKGGHEIYIHGTKIICRQCGYRPATHARDPLLDSLAAPPSDLAAVVEKMRKALDASVHAADSHYNHWDKQGTAGANCPACISRREANDKARAALRALQQLDQEGTDEDR